ncbi:MAG: hypothetical protein QM754_18935 [Tepidisphaeraceae bacterium]
MDSRLGDTEDFNGRDHFGTELEHLQHAAGGQLRAAKACREADEVFDTAAAARLPAGAELVEDDGVEAFTGGVDGGGQPGRAAADDGQVDLLPFRAPAPDAGLFGDVLERRRVHHAAVSELHSGPLSLAVRVGRHLLDCRPAVVAVGVEPAERDEIFVKEFADFVRAVAAGRADNAQPREAGAVQRFTPRTERLHQFFAEPWHGVEDAAELVAGHAQHGGRAAVAVTARHRVKDDRAAHEQIDIADKAALFVVGNATVVIERIQDVDAATFDDEQIDIRLAGAEQVFPLRVSFGLGERADLGEVVVVECREESLVGGRLNGRHSVLRKIDIGRPQFDSVSSSP